MRILTQIGHLSKGRKLNIRLITKIPQQFWNRNKVLEQNCFNERQKDPNLRTQVRLGRNDLELRTKYRSEIYWRTTPLEAYGSLPDPEIDKESRTPEGRNNKRGANSPLTNEISKRTNMGSTPESIEI